MMLNLNQSNHRQQKEVKRIKKKVEHLSFFRQLFGNWSRWRKLCADKRTRDNLVNKRNSTNSTGKILQIEFPSRPHPPTSNLLGNKTRQSFSIGIIKWSTCHRADLISSLCRADTGWPFDRRLALSIELRESRRGMDYTHRWVAPDWRSKPFISFT